MENDNFYCKEEGHQEEEYAYVCINPNCQEQVRFFCQECSINSSHYVKEAQCGLIKRINQILAEKILPREFSNFHETKNYMKKDMRSISYQQEIEQMEQAMQQLKQNINEKIDHTIKNFKIQLNEHYQKYQQNVNEVQEKINLNYDITEIRSILQKFKNSETDYKAASQQIAEIVSKNERKKQDEIIMIDIINLRSKMIKFNAEDLQNGIQTSILNSIENLETKLIVPLSQNKIWGTLSFKISNLQQQQSFFGQMNVQVINQQVNNNLFVQPVMNPIYTIKEQGTLNSTPFSNEKAVFISFKVLEDSEPNSQNRFTFGISPVQNAYKDHAQWQDRGNQVDFKKTGNIADGQLSKDLFDVTGQQPGLIYQVGIQYDVEICVKYDFMRISESDKKTILYNKRQLEKQEPQWTMIFQNSSGSKRIQILKAFVFDI